MTYENSMRFPVDEDTGLSGPDRSGQRLPHITTVVLTMLAPIFMGINVFLALSLHNVI
jgi:hypothetical protein